MWALSSVSSPEGAATVRSLPCFGGRISMPPGPRWTCRRASMVRFGKSTSDTRSLTELQVGERAHGDERLVFGVGCVEPPET
jgi:hypothetical protein